MKNWWKITKIGILLLIAIFVWIFFIGIKSNQSGSYYNNSHNAIWVEHAWVGDEKSSQEIKELVEILTKHEIDTVFVHSGPLGYNGEVEPEVYQYAMNFLDAAKKFNPEIEYQAWLGQIRRKIKLSEEEVINNITKLSTILTEMVGFDGIHYDIEPVWDDDLEFINLVKETREVLSDEKKISVALAEFIPKSVIEFSEGIHDFQNYNSEVNYLNVAKYADQIVVMAYDTGLDSDWLYQSFLEEQTIWLTNLIEDKEVFIGIPSYEDVKEGFDPDVENIFNALHGIINGLNNIRSNSNNLAGVAIYPYWEMDVHEWQDFYDIWVK